MASPLQQASVHSSGMPPNMARPAAVQDSLIESISWMISIALLC